MTSLQHKTLLITGATQGIGRAVALACAREGADIIALARNKKRLLELDDEIREISGKSANLCQFDLALAGADDYQRLLDALTEQYQQLDGLIHCAAIFQGLTPIEHYAADKYFSTMQANCHARYLLTLCCLPLLRQSPHADVIFTVSKQANQAQAYWGAYAMADAACKALYELWAQEWANTTVTPHLLQPPLCDTGLMRRAYPFYEGELAQPDSVVGDFLDCLTTQTEAIASKV